MGNQTNPFWPIRNELQLRQLYEKYKVPLYNKAKYVLKDETSAEEVVQDVFIALWQNRETVTEVTQIDSYLFGILKHKVFDRYKQIVKNRVIAYVEKDLDHDPINEWYDAKELKDLLSGILEKMPKMQREVFRLSKLEGFKREEIAEKLNISPNTVKNHLLAGTKFLRENLDMLLIPYCVLNFSQLF